MDTRLRERTLSYLRDHNVMTLATTGSEGLWAAAVFYVNDGFTLYFLSAPHSRHSKNIASHSGISATIQEDYRDWREIQGIQLEGSARSIGGEQVTKAMEGYEAKFFGTHGLAGAPPEIAHALRGIAWYQIVPSRLYFIDNSQGLGHRDEVPLEGV